MKNEAGMIRAGTKLANELGLREIPGYGPENGGRRWYVSDTFRTKTAIGVYLSIQRLAEEAKQRAEATPQKGGE